jgi:hypothetical protein
MWTFNDDGATTSAFMGMAATNVAAANVVSATVVSATPAAVCSRVAKATFSGARITDVFCSQSGSVGVSGTSTFTTGDGLSQTFACNGGADFTFNQKWSGGAIVEVTIKTSLNHRFRVGSNQDGSLLVDHQSWGGWTRLASGSGIISEDRSAYSISESQFVIQAANIGWISVTQAGGFLNYQYALDSTTCAAATCNFLTAQQFQYDFSNPPLPEPMGNQQTTEGIQNLPPVLACPTPTLTGYNPFMYCWGWWVGPQVGYARDWNGNQWQTSDPGCCRNQAILDGSQWTIQRWGYLIQGKTLPWCESYTVPPLDPPKSATSLPTYPSDPCTGVAAADLTNYQTICTGLWGNDPTDGRYVGCVAQLCITADPTTVPPPDCRTEKLLATMDSNYVVPSTCTSCPNSCSFQGSCNPTTLVCTCQAGFTGPDCSQPTSFPCFATGDGTKVQPFQLKTLDSNFPNSPVLDISMNDAIYTQFAFPGKYTIADTLFIYLVQSIDAFNSPNAEYHLWAVSGNGAGSVDVDYTVSITATQFPGTTGPTGEQGAELDVLGNASPVAGVTQTSSIYPNLDMTVSGTTVSVRITHRAGQIGGFVLRKLPANFLGTIKLTANGNMIPQVLLGGASSSAKAVFDVEKISYASMTSGFTLGGLGASSATICTNNANECANLNCAQCTSTAACGWCVETAQCFKGDASGPAFGECLNWRKTFDATTNRRVTQIPAYPVNPGLTEVFLATASDLPIGVGLTPVNYLNSEWDAIVFADMGSPMTSQGALAGQIQDILSTASGYPNMGIAFASIVPTVGYQLIEPITNPRATDSIPTAITSLSASKQALPLDPTFVGTSSMKAALAKLATGDDFRLRVGTRKMALFMSQRNNDGVLDAASAQALLVKNIVPVFAVSPQFAASYYALVRSIGFGYVIPLSPGLASVFNRGLAVAGSSVNILVPTADQTGSHIDMTSFNTNVDRFTVQNLPANFRALFSIPVKPYTGANLNQVATTHLVFPGFGNALIENIPATLAEKPWTTGITSLSTKDNAGAQLIELTGMSFRGLMAVTPTILTVPDTTVGDLHYAQYTTDANGVTAWTAGDLITGTQLIAAGKVVFLPKAAGTTSFTYSVADMCIASAPGTVNLQVLAADQAPVADMPNLVTRQYTPLSFELGFGDDSISSGGQYTFTITQTVAAADGYLYQYVANFDPTNPGTPIASGDVITTQQVIYMPPQYKYSDATNPALLTLPCFNYLVTETAPNNLPSNEKQVLITVTHVNVPPFVWDDPAWPSTLLGAWPTVDASWCKDTCTFQEDFGEQFWWNAGFEYVYLGGNDVEGSILTYELTNIDCFPGTTLLIPLDNTRNAVVGDQILQNQPGSLNPTLRFRPARETSNTNRAALDGAAHYCTIGYHVIDDQGAVSSDKTITIDVTPVNKQPRLDDTTQTVYALAQQKQQFFLNAIDPEGDAFTVSFSGCAKNQGVIELCKDSDCTSTHVLDCSVIYDATNPTTVALTDVQTGVTTSDGLTLPIQGFFTSGPVATSDEGNLYNTIYLSFADNNGVSTFPATQAEVIFDVMVLNNPPVLTVMGQDVPSYSASVSAAETYTPTIQVSDPDFVGESFFVMTVDVTLDNSNTPSVTLNKDRLSSLAANYDTCQDGLVVSETQITITCGIDNVNELLFAIVLNAPEQLAQGQGLVTLKVHADDNGYSGQCPTATPGSSTATCHLTADTTVSVTFTPIADNSLVTVASSSAAAGVAGAAAIAAVALFRKFNKKAEDNYQPWDDDTNSDETTVNPLYQESGSKGENPLFEAANPL